MGLTRLIPARTYARQTSISIAHPLPLTRRILACRYPGQCLDRYSKLYLSQHLNEPRLRPLHTSTSKSFPGTHIHASEPVDSEIKPSPKNSPKKSKTRRKDERDLSRLMVPVFDGEAPHDRLPRISFTRIDEAEPSVFTCDIHIPRSDIKATASSDTPIHAQILAAINLKTQKDSTSNTETRSDNSALNITTARKFLQFCQEYGKSNVHVRLREDPATCPDTWCFTPLLDDEPLPSTQAATKSQAKDQACLIAAIALKERTIVQHPNLLVDFRLSMPPAETNDYNMRESIKKAPVAVCLSGHTLEKIEEWNSNLAKSPLLEPRSDPRALGNDLQGGDKDPAWSSRRAGLKSLGFKCATLRKRLVQFRASRIGSQMNDVRSRLPMTQHSDEVIDLVAKNAFSIIIGATGSGKTTQVPQILLDSAIMEGQGAFCNIICTQPRRIAATSVASRVAQERNEPQGESVGHRVRFDMKPPKYGGSIDYCSTSVLLNQLSGQPDDLDHISHIILDEIHERSVDMDLLLILLKRAMANRAAKGKKMPKIILMSAMVETERFLEYFKTPGTDKGHRPVVSVPGRAFPVTHHYLAEAFQDMKNQHGAETVMEQLNIDSGESLKFIAPELEGEELLSKEQRRTPLALVATMIAHIAKTTSDGAILVFLPGRNEINQVERLLLQDRPLQVQFDNERRFRLYKLHSSMPEEQAKVFETLDPACRKIILSTNVAETSITIPDVQFVVDPGRVRQLTFDSDAGSSILDVQWASQSNVKQRAGRAGRVRDGHYYALYTQKRANSLNPTDTPPLLTSDLQPVCLKVASLRPDMAVADYLAMAVQPPRRELVMAAMRRLDMMGALSYATERLNPLGWLLTSMPLHPSLAKMVVFGLIFKCLDAMIALAVMGSNGSIWFRPLDKTERYEAQRVQRKFSVAAGGDHAASLTAFFKLKLVYESEGIRAAHAFAVENCISFRAFRSVLETTQDIKKDLKQAGFLTSRDERYASENDCDLSMVKTLLVAGLFPNLARPGGPYHWYTFGGKRAGCSQMISKLAPELSPVFKYERLVVYNELVKFEDDTFLADISPIPPFSAFVLAPGVFQLVPGAHGASLFELSHDLPTLNPEHMKFWVNPAIKGRTWEEQDVSSLLSTIFMFRDNINKLLEAMFISLSQPKSGRGLVRRREMVTEALTNALMILKPQRTVDNSQRLDSSVLTRNDKGVRRMGAEHVFDAWSEVQKKTRKPVKKSNGRRQENSRRAPVKHWSEYRRRQRSLSSWFHEDKRKRRR